MSALFGIGGFIDLLTARRNGAIDLDGVRITDHVAASAALLGTQYSAPEVTKPGVFRSRQHSWAVVTAIGVQDSIR